jgi:hypothetical protein
MSKQKDSKYGAKRTEVDGITFHSKAEARRYQELRLLEKAGEVKELELQPKFPLHVPVKGRANLFQQVAIYIADFRYRRGPRGVLVIEDVKSEPTKTPVYRLKKRMFETQYGLEITEVLR